MPKTVDQGALSENRSKEREVFGLANRLRDVVNYQYRTKAQLTTAATATLTAIWTSPDIPERAVWKVRAEVNGRSTAGGAGVATYELIGLFYREVGGSLTQEGATVELFPAIETDATFDADLTVSGNAVLVRVRDDGVRTMSWSVDATVAESS